MKNKVKILVALIAILATAAVILAFALNPSDRAEKNPEGNNLIKRSQAREIALTNLGVKAENTDYATVVREELNGKEYYSVEIDMNGVIYRYRIDATNGDIVKMYINDEPTVSSPSPIEPQKPTVNYIGVDAAKEIAFTDAGVTKNEVTDFEQELDFFSGKYYYEIEFRANGSKYEYDIDATDGSIFKKDINKVTVIEPTPIETTVQYIGVKAAKAIALGHAELLEADVVFESAKWEKEKGTPVYEIDFRHNTTEYEYTINALTGTIIYFEKEIDKNFTPVQTTASVTTSKQPQTQPTTTEKETAAPVTSKNEQSAPQVTQDKTDPTSPSTGATITMQQAKSIALAHAGLLEDQVRWEDCEFEKEHGVLVYELDFKCGNYEYEYVINAQTGKIIEADKERDD